VATNLLSPYYTWDGFDKHWQENRAQQGSGCHPNVQIKNGLIISNISEIEKFLTCG